MLNRSDDPRFTQLMKALAAGWEIDEPVLIRSTWREITHPSGTYHFVLRQKAQDKTTLLSLPPSPELLTFLAERKISVTPL
ncbi:MAG: hypothetical protein KJ077_37875 [Anaerolineae bacterium]|nr:hypothetical protein [Anaerolineae bacterium]